MLHIKAACMGPVAGQILRTPGCGRILGVFHRGWYLEVKEKILLVYDGKNGEIPFGIGVENFETRFPYQKILEGAEVKWADKTLLFPQADLVIDFCLPVPGCEKKNFALWEVRRFRLEAKNYMDVSGRGFLFPLLAEAKRIVCGKKKYMEERVSVPWCREYFPQMFREKIERFFWSLQREPEKLHDSLKEMIGLGMGLTPVMDDWLVGFLYIMLRMPAGETEKNRIGFLCRESMLLAPERTNRISAAYLMMAAKGEYFEMLHKAVCNPSKGILDALCGIGHSSGTDILTGMVFAVFYIDFCTNPKKEEKERRDGDARECDCSDWQRKDHRDCPRSEEGRMYPDCRCVVRRRNSCHRSGV